MKAKTIRVTGRLAAILVAAALLVAAAGPVGAQQIDAENARGLVIDDMFYPFADNVEFYANPEKTILANRGDFRQGSKIGFELDEERKLSVVWLQ